MNILSYGQNQYRSGSTISIHAEHDAVNKLPFSRKIKKINMLVLKFSDNKLSCSKPCIKCQNMMHNYFQKKGYEIKHIYYSSTDGNIKKITLNNLK